MLVGNFGTTKKLRQEKCMRNLALLEMYTHGKVSYDKDVGNQSTKHTSRHAYLPFLFLLVMYVKGSERWQRTTLETCKESGQKHLNGLLKKHTLGYARC